MNLVSLIMQYLAPAIINRMAGSLGINQGLAGKAIAAALPAILAGLAGSASKPGGASALSNLLAKQDPGLLGNLGGLLGGANQQSLIDSGTGALSSLLGGSSAGAIASAVGKFAGISDGQGKGLIGMLAPVVLGTLANQQRTQSLDAGGLAGLLASQKDNIAAALPAGFSDLLKGTGVLDSIAPNLQAAPAARRNPPAEMAPEPSSGGIMKYLIPLAIAAAVLYLLLGRGQHEAVTTTEPAKVEKAAPVSVIPQQLTKDTTSAIEALTASIGTVKDEASAKTALPKLQEIAAQFSKIKASTADLPTEARHPLAVMIAGVLPGVASAIDKALALPGVGPVLKPVLDDIATSLGVLAKQ